MTDMQAAFLTGFNDEMSKLGSALKITPELATKFLSRAAGKAGARGAPSGLGQNVIRSNMSRTARDMDRSSGYWQYAARPPNPAAAERLSTDAGSLYRMADKLSPPGGTAFTPDDVYDAARSVGMVPGVGR